MAQLKDTVIHGGLSVTGTVVSTGTVSAPLVTPENTTALKLRTHASYETGIVYGTAGNEAITFAMQNPVTAFQIVYGTAPSGYSSGTWQSVTPLFQTKDGKVIINRKITQTSETSSLKLLDVNGEISGTKVYGAVFNDYAEYRYCKVEDIKPGQIFVEDEDNCDFLKLCDTEKPNSKVFIYTDTFGYAIGDQVSSIPVAISGRVLMYVEAPEKLKVGDFIGAGKNGIAKKISKRQAMKNPHSFIGSVSSIPSYLTWGTDKVKVNGRVWVNLK